MGLSKREQLLRTALALFKKHGFHAIGVDVIAHRSGVTKKTLYHHIPSNDELILAVLRYYDERFRNHFIRQVEARAKTPLRRLTALFDVAKDWFNENDFYGCLFVGALGEFPEPDTAIRNACRESKNLMRDYFRELAEGAGASKPKELADQLLLLMEGAITMAQVNHSPFSAQQAKAAARVLIRNARSSAQ